MLGAVTGDIVGSIYKFNNIKTTSFPLFQEHCFFTDDTVLTIALADSLLTATSYGCLLKEYYRQYPNAGYGGSFRRWAASGSHEPYNSWGNGAAMRISPVGFWYDTLEEVMAQATACTAVTHNHPEGIKGAQATAAAVFMARTGSSKQEIKDWLTDKFGYDLSRSCDEIRPGYVFDVSCQGTVPQAVTAFLESGDFEDAIRLAVSLGGDCDTLTCITGGIAEAFYGGVPETIASQALCYLDQPLRSVLIGFYDALPKTRDRRLAASA